MKNFFPKIFFTMMLAFAVSAFVACDKNNDDDDESQNQENTPEEVGVEINGITWATRNVDAPGTFADTPESRGMFYQFNRKIGWSSTDQMVNSNGGTTWDDSTPSGTEWEKENDPCPSGWRLPTHDEQVSLLNSDISWTTQNGVTGTIFGSGSNTLFLPAAGSRNYYDGTLGNTGARAASTGRVRSAAVTTPTTCSSTATTPTGATTTAVAGFQSVAYKQNKLSEL